MILTTKEIDRFWSKVDKNGSCWIWLAALDGRGYGKFVTWANSKHTYHIATRIVWQLLFGDISTKQLVCHKCDNPKCVNPDHLFLGSSKDNAQDMRLKGRHQYRVGEYNPNSKLTAEQVDSIRIKRLSGVSAKLLALEFKVAPNTIYNLCNPNQKCWTGRRRGIKDDR